MIKKYKKYTEAIRWYSGGKLGEPEPSLGEPEPSEEISDFGTELKIIGWQNYNDHWGADGKNIFILENIVERNGRYIIIFYNNHSHDMGKKFNVKEYITILSNKELEEHIFNNETPIYIFNGGKNVYWEDLSDDLKDRLL